MVYTLTVRDQIVGDHVTDARLRVLMRNCHLTGPATANMPTTEIIDRVIAANRGAITIDVTP